MTNPITEAVARALADVPVWNGLDLIDAVGFVGYAVPKKVMHEAAQAAISAHLKALHEQGYKLVKRGSSEG